MKLLLVGPKYNKIEKAQLGGIVVLFENLINYCNANNIEFEVIDTNKKNYNSNFKALSNIIKQLHTKIKHSDIVMLNGTFKDYLFIGPFLQMLCAIYKKPYVLRKFAGNFHKNFNSSNFIIKKLLNNTLKKAALCFWETKELVDWGRTFNTKSIWFPNVRSKPAISLKNPNDRNKTLVFISAVKKEKGIDKLLQIYPLFKDRYNLEIYGNLIDYNEEELQGFYKGVLTPKEVHNVLNNSYLLVLLSSWKAEGYPGIISEAFSVGVPVLASKMGGIPEMIKDGYNGFLVDVDNDNSIIEGIERLEASNYQELCKNALKSFDDFNEEIVMERIFNKITEVSKSS